MMPSTPNTRGPIHFVVANTVYQLIHYNQALYRSMRCNIKWEMLPLCSATFMSGVGTRSVNILCLFILYLCFLHPHKHSLTHCNMVLNKKYTVAGSAEESSVGSVYFNDSWKKGILMALCICRYYASSTPPPSLFRLDLSGKSLFLTKKLWGSLRPFNIRVKSQSDMNLVFIHIPSGLLPFLIRNTCTSLEIALLHWKEIFFSGHTIANLECL